MEINKDDFQINEEIILRVNKWLLNNRLYLTGFYKGKVIRIIRFERNHFVYNYKISKRTESGREKMRTSRLSLFIRRVKEGIYKQVKLEEDGDEDR